ncbi:MAG: DUF3667 domain-containing protein [Gammaproteobacteria bacterium]|nr:DUF3667 domain-containing protein [Gammaproteobacteria bacterium]
MAEQTFTHCPNCGKERDARFCPNCGQNDRNYLRSLIPVLWEIVRETFEIDGRLFRSLRLLVTRPGALSIEFSENRRAQYMSPIRMYLFVSILFFFTLTLNTEIAPMDTVGIAGVEADTQGVLLNDDNLELFKRLLSSANRDKVDQIVARTDSLPRLMLIATANSLAEEPEEAQQIGETQRFLIGQLVEVLDKPEVALDKLMDNLPIALFLLLPVYAVLLQLFYLGSGRFYVEHLIFGVYLHTLAFLLFTVLMVLPDEISVIATLSSFLQLGFLVYYFMALKRYYGQNGFVTTLKFIGLLFSYSILLIPCLLLVMAATFTQL